MKKIIALVLVLSFIVSGMAIPVNATETEGVAIEFEILKQLGIIGNDIDLEAIVTRGEFAEYIGRMLNVGSNYTDKRYFTDVAANSIINALTEMGIFNGTAEQLFEPDDKIELTHACVALIKALGYRLGTNNVTINDYVLMAKRLDITDGVNLGGEATNEIVLRMIYNTLMTVAGEPDTYIQSGDSWEYSVSPDGNQTLIELIFDAYILRGVVTENFITGLYDVSSISKDRIKIDTTEFKCELESAEKLIGQNVVALVSFKDGKSAMHTVLYMTPDEDKNETIVIDADQIESYDNYVLKYYNEAGNLREVRFLPSMSLIYNGVAIGKNYDQYFDFDTGTVKCIKSNKDSYSVAVIEHIENVKVKAVDLVEDIIYTDGTAPYNALDMSNDDIDTYKEIYIPASGKGLGVKSLSSGDLLSVIRSVDGKYIEVYLCTETIAGTLSSVSGGSEKVYTIDGVEYEAAYGYDPLAKYNIGDKVRYVVDITGKIAAEAKPTTQDDKILGYMYMMDDNDGAFEKTVKFKVYTQNQEHLVLECADKVLLNGERIKEADVSVKLKKADGSFNRSMILFKLNKDGELSYIDTPAETKAEREETNSLWKMAEEGNYTFDISARMFRPYYAATTETYVFCIPYESDANPSNLAFGVYKFSGSVPFTRNSLYNNVGMYKFSEDTPYIDVVTMRRSDELNTPLSMYSDVLLVDEIVAELGEESEIVNKIYGLFRDTAIEYRVEPELDISSVGSGDIINFGRNARGYISSFEVLYDYSNNTTNWGSAYESAAFNSGERYTFGYLDSIYINYEGNNTSVKSLFNVSATLGGDLVEAHAWHTNYNTFMIYDGSRSKNKAYLGSINDLVTYENVQNEASRLFVHWRYQNRISWIFYK